MPNDYFIKLQPLAPFYFGQELGYELGNKNNYFQHSADFPQQSALLGFLRHQVLQQIGISLDFRHSSRNNVPEAQKAIGEHSFKPFAANNKKNTSPYGYILGISPVFITNGSNKLFVRNKEFVLSKNGKTENDTPRELYVRQDGTPPRLLFREGREQKSFTAKDRYVSYLADTALGEKQEYNDLIHTPDYTGIHKPWGVSFMEERYFRRTYKDIYCAEDAMHGDPVSGNSFQRKLKQGWGLGFIARFSDQFKFDDAERPVFLGKERSVFLLNAEAIKKKKKKLQDYFPDPKNESGGSIWKVVLLCDAFIDQQELKDLGDCCILQQTDQTRFKNIIRRTKRDFYASISREMRSHLPLNLVKRGSVFWVKKDNIKCVEGILNNYQAFRRIGYNYYITIAVKPT